MNRNMSSHFDLIIKEAQAFLSHPKNPYDLVEEVVDIGISNGVIAKIGSLGKVSAEKVFSAKNLITLPGLMDSQVHFREPGMEHKETIESGSRSALLGGMSAFLEMPNTFPPTTTKKLLEEKIAKAEKSSWCDFGFFIGASPENIDSLPDLEKQMGSLFCGIKVFMGSSTGSLLLYQTKDLEQLLKTSTKKIAVHSEDEARLKERKHIALASKGDVSKHTLWRDPETALLSTKKIVEIAEKYGKKVHILHVTTEEEIQFLAKKRDFASVEVTPQHLSLVAPDCYEKLGTLAQMNPPIREKRHSKALWEALRSGLVTMMGSDHAPHSLEEKQKTYPESPAGMPGTQTMLPLMLDHVNQKRLSLKRLTELLAINPHRHYKIEKQGMIREGFMANLSFIDLKKRATISGDWLASKCAWSPFEGKTLTGWPMGVLLHGQWAMRETELIGEKKGLALQFGR